MGVDDIDHAIHHILFTKPMTSIYIIGHTTAV